MIAKIVGYKVLTKNDKMLCLISYLRESRANSGEVGMIAESNFIPPYCIEKVDSLVGKLCNINFHKYNDKYTISNVDVVNTSCFNTD